MKKLTFFIFLFIAFSSFLLGQSNYECHTEDNPTGAPLGGGDCDDYLNYIPNSDFNFQNTPTLTFRISFHFMRDGEGGGIYEQDQSANVAQTMLWLNSFYNNIYPPTLPVNPPVEEIDDSRIQFVESGIHYHNSADWYESNVLCGADYRDLFGIETDRIINIFFFTKSNAGSGGCGPQSYVNMINYTHSWAGVQLIGHELGHVIGLPHTFTGCNDDVFDDTYHPDLNRAWLPCGPDVSYTATGCTPQNYTGISNNIMGYNTCRSYLSPKQMGYVHFFNITKGHKRKYIKSDFDPNEPNVVINNDALWTSSKVVNSDIIIEPNKELTIKCNVYLSAHAKIIVKPAGRLIIDGGTLTSLGNQPWQGIQVWGNKQQSQWPDQYGVMHQGLLEIKNGAIIENAIDAVVLWNPDNYSSTGGVVQANDAVFRNNARAVHALMYWNFNPLNPEERLPNRSYFKNTTFELTEDYHGDEVFSKHVDLFDVFGIDFKACDFTLDPKAKNVSYFNHGIAAYSAGFSLLPVCAVPNVMPCPGYLENTFTGFNRGVSATNALNFSPPFFANRAAFSNNTYGVHVNDVDNFTVINSSYNVGIEEYKGECKSGFGVGIYTDLSTGFAIEENNFNKYMAAPPGDYFGTWINNTEEADEVYKNDFSGLSYANYSEGKNWWQTNRFKGLAYFCNENQSNYADFYVGRDGSNVGGIQSKQGDLTHDAGNTFTQNGATWHFYNDGEHLIGYYHNNSQSNKIPDINKLHQVVPYAITYNNSCPSYYGGGDDEKPMAMSTAEQLQAEQQFIANLTDYNNVKALYTALTDGGNTDGTVFDIQTAHPDDMWALRAQLLGKSPHLSMEVLKEASDRTDVFNDAALFDILAANPDELKKDELINYLEQKEEPLPDYMVNILKQVAIGTTYKTVLEQQMSLYNRNKTRAAHNMIRHIVHDSIVDNNLLRQWLNNLGGIQSDKQIIGTFVQEGNYANALALANMLPQLYGLHDGELMAHNAYMDMLNLQQTLHQQERNLFQLTGAEKQQLDQLATGKGSAALQARAILEMVYNEYSEPCPCVDETGSFKNMGINLQGPTTANLLEVTARPNPAKDWVVFEFRLPGESPEAAIRISDAGGKLIETLPITGTQGQKMWDTRGLEPGTYYYTLIKAGEYKSGRIVIHR
jgi:hypothetical protein